MIKRVRRACLNCRNSKVACDQQRPCTRCVKLDIGSTCYDLPRKKREKKPKPQSTLTVNPSSICNKTTTSGNGSSITPILKKQSSNNNSNQINSGGNSPASNLSSSLSSNKHSINDGCLSLSSSTPSSPLSNLNFKTVIPSPSPKPLSISNICQIPSSSPSACSEISSPTTLTPPVQGLKLSNSNINTNNNNSNNSNFIYQTINHDERSIYIPSNQLGNYASSITISQPTLQNQYIKNSNYPKNNNNIYSNNSNNIQLTNGTSNSSTLPQQYFYTNKSNIYQIPSTQSSIQNPNPIQVNNDTTSFIIAKPCKRSFQSTNPNPNGGPIKKLNCSQTISTPTSPQPNLSLLNGDGTTTIYYQPQTHTHTPPLLPQQNNQTNFNSTTNSNGNNQTYYTTSTKSINSTNPSTTPSSLIGKGGPYIEQQQDYHVVPVTSGSNNSLTFIHEASGSWGGYYPSATPPSPTPSLQQISSSPITSSSIIQSSNLVPSSQYRSSPVPLNPTYQLFSDSAIYNTYDSSGSSNTGNSNSNNVSSPSNTSYQYNTVYKYAPQTIPPQTTNAQYYTSSDLINSNNISNTSYYIPTATNNSPNNTQQTIIFNPPTTTIIQPSNPLPHHIINNYKII